MKKVYLKLSVISIVLLQIIQIHAQNGLDLLFTWSDASISNQNWVGNAYNEIWGVAQNGHEFAIIGSTQGTHIFDITNPENGFLTAYIQGADYSPEIVHRDFHDYNGYLYAVADEGESTLQIIDISQLPSSYSVVYDSDELIKRAHNIFIDSQNAIMYVCGGRVLNEWNNLSLFSIEEPENPIFLAKYDDVGYVHDIYVIDNIGYLNAGDNGLYIVDFLDVENPSILGSLTEYPFKGYNHSGWLNASGNTYVFADENHGYEMKICDVSNPSEISVIPTTILSNISSESIAHNLIIKDNYVYVSHYHDGLWIWDITNPSNPIVVAHYDTYNLSGFENNDTDDDNDGLLDYEDTYPFDYDNNGTNDCNGPIYDCDNDGILNNTEHTSYRGAWGVYPLLPSGNILVSDMQNGLFVLSPPENQSANTLEFSHETSIFPNPFKDELNIHTNNNDEFTISIFDINGKLLINEIVNKNIKLNTKLNSGVYLLEIKSEKESYTKKIIRQ